MSFKNATKNLAGAISIALIVGLFSLAKPTAATEEDNEELNWTFDQAENVGCFTVSQVINDGAPILVVVHDAEDHGWQFLTGQDVTMDDAMIISMGQIVAHDQTLLEIGTMPPGHIATRVAVGEPWNIEKIAE